MTSRHLDDVSDDSALESDIASPLSEQHDIDNDQPTEQTSMSGTIDLQSRLRLPEVERPRRGRRPAAGARNTVTSSAVSAPTNRRQHKPSAKYAALNSRKSACDVIAKPNRELPPVSSLMSSNATAAGVSVTSVSKKDRLLMRPWLVKMANTNQIANVCWYNDAHTQIRIPWKHGSRSCWTLDDCQLYKAWATHTGKYSASHGDEPKRWKANFRCALNSLPDVVEVKNIGQTRGNSPFKVYELKEEINKKTNSRRAKRNRRSKVERVEKQLPLAVTPASFMTSRIVSSIPVQPKKVDMVPDSRQVTSAPRRSAHVDNTYQTISQQQITMATVRHLLEQMKTTPTPATPTANEYQYQRSTSQVIPTVVEEMSLDEMTTREPSGDDMTYYDDADDMLETIYAVNSLQPTRLTRSTSSTPSESSLTDSGIFEHMNVDTMDSVWPDFYGQGISDFIIEETHGYHLLENADFPFDDIPLPV